MSPNGMINVVTRVHWGYTGIYTDSIGTPWSQLNYGVSDITPPDPLSFVSFESLTLDLVTNWLNQVFGSLDSSK